jgi:hypothetical protein
MDLGEAWLAASQSEWKCPRVSAEQLEDFRRLDGECAAMLTQVGLTFQGTSADSGSSPGWLTPVGERPRGVELIGYSQLRGSRFYGGWTVDVGEWLERMRGVLAAAKQTITPNHVERTLSLSGLADESWMDYTAIAHALNLPANPLRCRLDRWRNKRRRGDGWRAIEHRTRNDPLYEYQIKAIRKLLEAAIFDAARAIT